MPNASFFASRAFAEVDTAAIAANFCTVSTHCGKKAIAVVKANAYGHGVELAVPALVAAGCRFFAVATPDEALAVRTLAPDADILVLGYTPPDAAAQLSEGRITQTVFSTEYALALAKTGVPLAVHIKIDCGMCRLGFSPAQIREINALFALKTLTVTGLFTHFPCADTDVARTRAQLARFCLLRAALPRPLFAHAAASAAALALPEAVLDAPRVGLALYGISPVAGIALRPALRLCAPLVQIREIAPGTAVSYGGDFVAKSPTRIGVLPCGYADGLHRCLQGMTVYLCHNGIAFPLSLCGRICMDQCMVDLGNTPAEVGDVVCLYRDVEAVAARAGTIPYEILSNISPRVVRWEKGRMK